ncbi:hypothetical protein [Mycoplasma elephantis]|uniref:hypothetical protein n=1 Tax=Mycoplasma elephantis TaxID=114882 RepID=UPI00068CF654|nr:hypothetical protein [Mycoplasma elephantis]
MGLNINNIQATRNFNLLYVILDCLFLIVLLGLFIYKKEWNTLKFSLFGGFLYFIVDYGYFHLISNSRKIMFDSKESETIMALVLLWMSLSYGITNFAFIWLCLDKNKDLKYYLLLIIGWWLIAPSASNAMNSFPILTSRTTSKYHWIMAFMLIVGYIGVIIYNLIIKDKNKRVPIFHLIAIGVSVQFGWEASLLINGIRPWNEQSFQTLIINSLIETNLGMPYIYIIWVKTSKQDSKVMDCQDKLALSFKGN